MDDLRDELIGLIAAGLWNCPERRRTIDSAIDEAEALLDEFLASKEAAEALRGTIWAA